MITITARVWLIVAGVTVGAIALGTATTWVYKAGVEKGRTEVTNDWQREAGRAIRAVEEASAKNRAEGDRRAARQQELLDAAELERADTLLALDAADAAGERFRVRLAAANATAARRCRAAGDPGTVEPGASAADAAELLADVPRRLEAAGREFAAIAQARGAAGTLCQQEYDALRPPTP